MSHRVVGDVAAIEANGFAIEEVGERFVGGGRVAERTGSDGDSADEVFAQLAVDAEAHTNAGAIAINAAQRSGGIAATVVLEKALAADADIAVKAETAQGAFERRDFFSVLPE